VSFKASAQHSMAQVKTKAEFDQLSGLPLSEKYGQVSALKLVYEIQTKQLYFLNARYFKFHHEFCSRELEGEIDLEYFNSINYSDDPKRKYLLANINYYKSLNTYALEISPVDMMPKNDIAFLYDIVAQATFMGDDLHLLLNSSRLQALRDEFVSHMPLLDPSVIYRNLNYQAIAKYKNCGVLRYIHDFESEQTSLAPMDIAILNETPLFLPEVAGIIVTEFQTPLSHLSILGQNRKIPIAAYKQAFNDSSLLSLNTKKVCYSVMADTFSIEAIDRLKQKKQKHKSIKLKYDLKTDSLIGIEHINKRSYKFAGNKAANFGILNKLSRKYDFNVPECAFVIPFYFYKQHTTSNSIKPLIDSLLTSKDRLTTDSLQVLLKTIRDEIKQAPINKQLISDVYKRITSDNTHTRMRFRSSTNAEDAKGFSGAGLYTSKTGMPNNEKKSFEKAIKKVWASLWSYQAFAERDYYNINHAHVFMGILVHRSFPDEKVNGVAITKNLYRPGSYGFVINAQLGDESVVKPKHGHVSDQFICYPDDADKLYKDKTTVDIITQSNLNGNKLVMTNEEIQHLANQLKLIKQYYIRHSFTAKSYLDFGLDIEFKLDKENRALYIKQVRLYND